MIREQLDVVADSIASGQSSRADYVEAMRVQLPPMIDVLDNIPLMANLAGADGERFKDLRMHVDRILAEITSLFGEIDR